MNLVPPGLRLPLLVSTFSAFLLTPSSATQPPSFPPTLGHARHRDAARFAPFAAPWDGAAITQILRPADARFPEPVMGRTLRTERWRYTEWNEGRAGAELYDHASDPRELHNLARDDAHATTIRELRARLAPHARGTPPEASTFNPARL